MAPDRFKPWLVICLLALMPARALAAVEVELVDTQLERRPVQLQSLREGVLVYFGRDRNLQAKPIEGFVRIEQPTDRPQPPVPDDAAVVAQLNDGQRLVGRWDGSLDDGQILVIEHAALGPLRVPLDKLRLLTLTPTPDTPDTPDASDAPRGAEDRVVLTNGDALTGFIVSLTPNTAQLQLESGRSVQLPIDRVQRIALANPDRPLRAHLVHLADGSRLAARQLALDDEGLRFLPELSESEQPLTTPVDALVRIDLVSEAGRLVALSNLPRAVTGGGQVLGAPMPPTVAEGSWRLHAPMTLRIDLPEGAARFAAAAALDRAGDVAESAWAWAGFELVLRVDGEQIHRAAIDAEHDHEAINLPIDGRVLEVELIPGRNGPVLDRLRLDQPVLFVQPTP